MARLSLTAAVAATARAWARASLLKRLDVRRRGLSRSRATTVEADFVTFEFGQYKEAAHCCISTGSFSFHRSPTHNKPSSAMSSLKAKLLDNEMSNPAAGSTDSQRCAVF